MDLRTVGVVLALCVPFVLLTIWAVIDASGREFGTLGRKAVWMMVAAVPFVGFIFYFLVGRRSGQKPEV
jgi:hypothetical protein